jgi:hypothetical protein
MIREGESVVAKAETGSRVPTREVFEEIVTELGIAGSYLAVLNDLWWLARKAENPEAARTVPWFETEAQAHTLSYWSLLLFPGIVQTEAYARALFKAWGHDDDAIEELVRLRIARQSILAGPNAPDVTIVLWERMLDTPIMPDDVMAAQLGRLVELSEQRSVHVHVLPLSAQVNEGMGGPISLAKTATDEVLVVEASEDFVTSDPVRVRKAAGTFSSVRADALPRAESRARLLQAKEKLCKTTPGGSPATAGPQGRTPA